MIFFDDQEISRNNPSTVDLCRCTLSSLVAVTSWRARYVDSQFLFIGATTL